MAQLQQVTSKLLMSTTVCVLVQLLALYCQSTLSFTASSRSCSPARVFSPTTGRFLRLPIKVSAANGNKGDEMRAWKHSATLPLPEKPPYLTAREVSLREQELEFLGELVKGDEALHKLRFLWYSERGPTIEKSMREAWQNMGHPDRWPMAEETLRSIIKETERTYLFAFVLLAKLFVLQGRFQESRILCERLLFFKPYHPSVLETMIAATVGETVTSTLDCSEDLMEWSAKQLPRKSSQRAAWVKWALDEAHRLLEQDKQYSRNQEPTSKGSDEGILRDIGEDNYETLWD